MTLAILFGIAIGLALGLTGGGGSIFAIPLLIYGLGMDTREAITLSLAAVTAVALFGSVTAARRGLIEFRAGIIFAVAGLVAAPAGVAIANLLADQVILLAFAVLMLVVATAMWRKSSSAPESTRVVRASMGYDPEDPGAPPCRYNPGSSALQLTAPCSAVLVVTGIATGVLSGLFGVGGGFIIVPALTLVTQLSIQRAVATSLLAIGIIGASGVVAGLTSGRQIDPGLTAAFVAGGIFGMVIGQHIARRVAGPVLQRIFAATMVAVAAVMLLVQH